jgi:hypothetical protein
MRVHVERSAARHRGGEADGVERAATMPRRIRDVLPDSHRAADREQSRGSGDVDGVGSIGAEGGGEESPVVLRFGPLRRREMRTAIEVCRDHGWPLSSSERPAGFVVVPGRYAVRSLLRLEELGAAPDKARVRSADLRRLEVRALHEALPPGTTLKISG